MEICLDHLLLKLQNYLIKGNEVQCFNTYKKMLDFSASRPLAIKGLILIANKNGDSELFSNMLVSAKSFKMPLDTFIFELEMFSIKIKVIRTSNVKMSFFK